jgi:dolichol kinase
VFVIPVTLSVLILATLSEHCSPCHPERSEGSRYRKEILRCAQNDREYFCTATRFFNLKYLINEEIMRLTAQEINRKLLHLFALLMPAGIFYIPKISGVSTFIPAIILAILLAAIAAVEKLRFNYPKVNNIFQNSFSFLLRKEESQQLTGSTYLIGAALLCALLFRDAPHISFMSLSLFILGDAVAALTGQSIGKIKIGKKSLEGSLACFLLCVMLFFAVFPYIPMLLDIWGGTVPAPLVFITSFAVTIFELLPLKITENLIINDNLAVPVIAGLFMKYLYPFFC